MLSSEVSMSYPTYLVHFNANHDKLGRFDTGDGDHDGIVDDHGHLKSLNNQEYNSLSRKNKKKYVKARRELNNRIINRSININYVDTSEGKNKYKRYMDAIDTWEKEVSDTILPPFGYPNYDSPKVKKALSELGKAERDFNISAGRYVAKQLIEEFGAQNVAELSFGNVSPFLGGGGKSTVTIKYKDVNDLIEKYAKESAGVYYD